MLFKRSLVDVRGRMEKALENRKKKWLRKKTSSNGCGRHIASYVHNKSIEDKRSLCCCFFITLSALVNDSSRNQVSKTIIIKGADVIRGRRYGWSNNRWLARYSLTKDRQWDRLSRHVAHGV